MFARTPWAARRLLDMQGQDRHRRNKIVQPLPQNFEQKGHTESSDLQEPVRISTGMTYIYI